MAKALELLNKSPELTNCCSFWAVWYHKGLYVPQVPISKKFAPKIERLAKRAKKLAKSRFSNPPISKREVTQRVNLSPMASVLISKKAGLTKTTGTKKAPFLGLSDCQKRSSKPAGVEVQYIGNKKEQEKVPNLV